MFNHVDIIISYHSGKGTDWGQEIGLSGFAGGRIVAAKLEPRRYSKNKLICLLFCRQLEVYGCFTHMDMYILCLLTTGV